ncbi:hypothetical protein D7V91_11485 [bacterium 1xD42-67]|nr:hypothetical protein D7V91_11485 [bacterium 1xD42-67]
MPVLILEFKEIAARIDVLHNPQVLAIWISKHLYFPERLVVMSAIQINMLDFRIKKLKLDYAPVTV